MQLRITLGCDQPARVLRIPGVRLPLLRQLEERVQSAWLYNVADLQGIGLGAGYPMGDVASASTFQSDETSLTAGLLAGSEEAFAGLIARFHQPVFSLLARTMYARADAADLTQGVFVKLYREVRSIRGESSLRMWIYRVALREAAIERRWWMRHKQQKILREPYLGCGECRTPMLLKHALVKKAEEMCEIAVHTLTKSPVEGALRKVPEPFRTTLILCDIEGFLYEEVAEIQGVNLRTVKSRLMRGRTCLKALLAVPAAHPRCVESSGFASGKGANCHLS
jgi:RNA polymerase sigma-70 factor (ECF subfamily)